MGNEQLKYIDEIVKKRRNNFLKLAPPIYLRTDRYYPIRFDHIDFLSNFAVPVVCKSVKIRDKLVKKCEGRVEIRPVVGGDLTQQPFFLKHMNIFKKILGRSNARVIHEQGLYFGNNPDLTNNEMQEIIAIFTS